MSRYIIDVREPEEYDSGHVEGAINIPPSELMEGSVKLRDLPRDSEIVLYCVSGSRSAVSKNVLQSLGFTNVINGINKDQVSAKYGARKP